MNKLREFLIDLWRLFMPVSEVENPDTKVNVVDKGKEFRDKMINDAEKVIEITANVRKWTHIIIHHSLTKDGKIVDWVAIKNWHTGKVGSSDKNSPDYNPYIAQPDVDIGYHFGIEYVDGILIYEKGRLLSMRGAHTIGMNGIAIGICVVGNFDNVIPTEEQYMKIAILCRQLMIWFGIPVDNVKGHRNYANKTCPGKKFDMNFLRSIISKIK